MVEVWLRYIDILIVFLTCSQYAEGAEGGTQPESFADVRSRPRDA